jgi:hypothetical protein
MKSVVVEKKDGYVALLCDDGRLVRMKDKDFRKGDVINMEEKQERRRMGFRKIALVAAMFVVLLGVGASVYNTPYYYVSLDVNPGIQMEVNRFERVIGAEALNEDAVKIVKGLEAKNKRLEDAIADAVDLIAEEGYFDDGEGAVMLAAIARNQEKAERLAGKLEGIANKQLEKKNKKAEVSSRVLGVEMVQLAKEAGITPGKYNIITNLLGEELGDNADESIKDLMARVKANKGLRENQGSNGKGNSQPVEKDEMYNKNGKWRDDETEVEAEDE